MRSILLRSLAVAALTGCHRTPAPEEEVLRCSPAHNPPVQRLAPRRPPAWRRGASVGDPEAMVPLVVHLSSESGQSLDGARITLKHLERSERLDLDPQRVARGEEVLLIADTLGRGVGAIRPGRYVIWSLRVGFVGRRDTIDVRSGFADTLVVQMREPLFCLY